MMNTWFQDFVSNDICILAPGARQVVFRNRAILATRAMSVGVVIVQMGAQARIAQGWGTRTAYIFTVHGLIRGIFESMSDVFMSSRRVIVSDTPNCCLIRGYLEHFGSIKICHDIVII